jgi:hypothetical protein
MTWTSTERISWIAGALGLPVALVFGLLGWRDSKSALDGRSGLDQRRSRLVPVQECRPWVERAAADASTWSTSHAGDQVAAQLEQVCDRGLRVATATTAQLAGLRAAAEPVYASLRADPNLATTLARIETLVRSAGPATSSMVPAACTYRPGDENRLPPPERTLTGAGRSGGLREGTYRYAFTVDELLAHGLSREDAENNAGVVDWTLRAGHWRSAGKPALTNITHHPTGDICEGWYDV